VRTEPLFACATTTTTRAFLAASPRWHVCIGRGDT
jgi:hypothetical protein